VDEYQVIEAKSIGADAILLIAAILTKQQIAALHKVASDLGMEVLLEIHDEEEIEKIVPGVKLVGVNNRSLKTMKVDLQTSYNLIGKLPTDVVRISESGIKTALQLRQLGEAGYKGFLMGEFFMNHARPEQACMNFIKEVSQLRKSPVSA
jgi:indole-3-glycerol phosphate synthase